MSKKIVIPLIALLGLAAGAVWYAQRPERSGTELVLHGNVDLRQVALAFNGSERIARLLVQEGEQVRAGQVLGELDTRTLNLRLAQARAQAEAQQQVLRRLRAGSRPEELGQARAATTAAQAEVDLAKQQQDRYEALERRAVSQQDVDTVRARYKTALAQLDSARKAQQLVQNGPRNEDIAQASALLDAANADAALLQRQLDEAQLKAPIDAVVRARLLEPGDMASPQRPVYTLAINNPKWIRAYVSEADLGHIRPGMAARIAIDSLPGETLPGKVGFISSTAEFTPKTVQTEELRTALVYEVRVQAEDKSDRLRLGMPATVRIAKQDGAGH
ncbi:HlyD family efflux transporter periplasmic adaptor subunit [Massilia sp. erpn]|uniref:HlyD family efflux transporter periplasmic adaptor subunit n=1 Tax=Massilia sp. erpn TaxID=2738142 RepID=UPI0021077943|nr:HlyD family efflux transporter periplasmic adaptor subunit [Massilia sp. erpn]UTY56316.1 HlyD family efflux transporter periplasmic adaptor subunit [Massilia sp. erpn]